MAASPVCGDINMLKGHSIVYFGPEKWEGMWRNRHQLMSRFAQYNKVMYVEPVMYLNHVRHQLLFHGSMRWKELCRLAKKNRIIEGPNNLYIYRSPVILPISGRFPFDRITWWAWKTSLRLTMRKLGFQKPIIWLSQHHMGHMLGSFNEKLGIYHVVDEYSAYGNSDEVNKQKVLISEQKTLKKADIVIVVSHNLYEAKLAYNEHTHIVPNGVDYESYDRALHNSSLLPSDITCLPKPIIGYSGLISRRLDLDLLEHIAINHPEWSLVLIGEVNDRGCENELNRLKALINVNFLGNKKIDIVPYYVRAFDVCIVPYKLNKQTQNLSPLKLYDYMAMGKEIVTTDFPIAREFKDVLHVAESKENFVNCIVKALSEKDKGLFAKRRQIAAQNTWEDRITTLSNIIESNL